MTKIKCSVESCAATFESDVPLSPKATYTCRAHTRPSKDEERFQKHQFDPDLRRSGSPIGTSHIHNQGSDILTAPDIDKQEEDDE